MPLPTTAPDDTDLIDLLLRTNDIIDELVALKKSSPDVEQLQEVIDLYQEAKELLDDYRDACTAEAS